MAKITLFFIVIISVLIYPIFESKNYEIKKEANINLPTLIIKNGNFFKYKINLIKKGHFKKLINNKKNYIAQEITIEDLNKKEILTAKEAKVMQNLIKLKDVDFNTSEYYLFAKKATYFLKQELIKGGKFKVYSKNFKGCGTEFNINKNKSITAKNVTYYLKAEK